MFVAISIDFQRDCGQYDVTGECAEVLLVGSEFSVGSSELDSEVLGLSSLAFPRVVSCGAVTLDALDPALLLLVLCLCTLSWRQRCLWCR